MIQRTLFILISVVAVSAPALGGTSAENLTKKPDRWFSSDEDGWLLASAVHNLP